MNIFSRIIDYKKHLDSQYNNKDLLDSHSVSNPNLSVSIREDAEICSSPTENLNITQDRNLTPTKNRKDMPQWSPAMQSLLEEPPSKLPLQLISSGIVFLFTFSLWAWFGEIDRVGKAQGKLVPKGEAYKIESLESAKVSYIAVEEGQEVQAGQLIARLDSEQEKREVARLQEILSSYQTELDRKRQMLEKVELETQTYKTIAKAEVQGQMSAIESAIAKAEVIGKLLTQQQSEMAAYQIKQKRVKELNRLEKEKLAQINLELTEHQQRVERLKPLLEEGAITQEAIFQAIQSQRQAQQQLIDSKLQSISSTNEQIFQSEQSLREIDTSITQSQGELVAARKEIERLQAELARQKADRQRLELEAQQKIQQLELEIEQTKAKITETENQLASAKDLLNQRLLKSPVAGTVLSFNVTNIGKVVQPGETVAEIAPHHAPLVLSAALPDREAGFVEQGMLAQVKFDAYSYQDYGAIPGKVISVSTDAKTDEKLGAVYQVRIELQRNYITDDLKRVLFKPGQTATADIIIRRRRVMDILLDPVKKLRQDGIDL